MGLEQISLGQFRDKISGTATYSRKFLNVGFFNQISEMKKTSQLENELEIMVYKFKGSKKKV